MCRLLAAMLLLVGPSLAAADPTVELSRLKAFAGKGRVQDREYHRDPLINQLLGMGPAAIPFLIEAIGDARALPGVLPFPDARVGDASFVILTDFLTDASGVTPCVKGGTWGEIVAEDPGGASSAYEALLKRIGRAGLQARMRALWREHADRLVWDVKDLCFRDRS